MSSELRLGFLGVGRMATALARGFLRAGLVTPVRLVGSDVLGSAREGFQRETGGRVMVANREVLEQADVVVLAVKPDAVTMVLEEVSGEVRENHLLISIAAGVPLARLESRLPDGTRVVRVMPNTPALVGASASAFALGTGATAADGELVARLFSSVGMALGVKEGLLDAVTGLSGSGPAYAYQMIEALSDGGVAAGLPREVATRLAAQTLLGAARMVLETGQHPAVLKDMVTSPGGTTIEGLHELEKAGVRGALMSAVRGAAEKSRRLARAG
jgi:pyrroline-5-carboxylate reductase